MKSNPVPTAIREQGLPGKFTQLVLKGNKPGRVTSESEPISRNERLWNTFPHSERCLTPYRRRWVTQPVATEPLDRRAKVRHELGQCWEPMVVRVRALIQIRDRSARLHDVLAANIGPSCVPPLDRAPQRRDQAAECGRRYLPEEDAIVPYQRNLAQAE
jgi:hypothetical protein